MSEMYPIRIEPCPIVECKMDVFCNFTVPNVAVIGLIYNALLASYPNNLKIKQLPVMNIPEDIRKADPNFKNQAACSITCGADGDVQIGPYGFSFSLKLPYKGWEVHCVFIEKVLKAVLNIKIIGDVSHINVRYLDFFKTNIFENINLKVEFEGREFNAVNPIYKVQFADGDILHILQITQGVHIENSILKLKDDGSLIDLTARLLNPVKTDMLLAFKRCHDANKRLFFDLLKQNYIATLNPVYE